MCVFIAIAKCQNRCKIFSLVDIIAAAADAAATGGGMKPEVRWEEKKRASLIHWIYATSGVRLIAHHHHHIMMATMSANIFINRLLICLYFFLVLFFCHRRCFVVIVLISFAWHRIVVGWVEWMDTVAHYNFHLDAFMVCCIISLLADATTASDSGLRRKNIFFSSYFHLKRWQRSMGNEWLSIENVRKKTQVIY